MLPELSTKYRPYVWIAVATIFSQDDNPEFATLNAGSRRRSVPSGRPPLETVPCWGDGQREPREPPGLENAIGWSITPLAMSRGVIPTITLGIEPFVEPQTPSGTLYSDARLI